MLIAPLGFAISGNGVAVLLIESVKHDLTAAKLPSIQREELSITPSHPPRR